MVTYVVECCSRGFVQMHVGRLLSRLACDCTFEVNCFVLNVCFREREEVGKGQWESQRIESRLYTVGLMWGSNSQSS